MKNFLSALIALSFCFPVVAQKNPPSKSKVNNNEVNKTKPVKNQDKKEVKVDSDSVKVSINMDKPLEQYFDSLNLSKEQIEKIAQLDEMQTQKDGMTRAKAKMTQEEISSMEKENLQFRNNKIYDILTVWQTKEIFLLQNGKLKTGRDLDFVINHLELKPSQFEQIKNIRNSFVDKYRTANKTENELDRIKDIESINIELEKNIKTVMDDDQAQMFDAIKSGKIDPTTEKEKKEIQTKAENPKKG